MSRRQEVIKERASRAPGEGPQRTKRPLLLEDVDTHRKLRCARYEECLAEMAIVGCRGWACPGGCPWFSEAARAEVPWRADEPQYHVPEASTKGAAGGDD